MNIEISYESEDKLGIPYEEIIEKVALEAMKYEHCPYEAGINVLLTDDDRIKELNSQFRYIDNTTDVLSFPMVDFQRGGDFSVLEDELSDMYFHPGTGDLLLGDIAISIQKIRSQAEAYGHSLERELAFLVAHSMFHLMGYDHVDDREREIMEGKQREVLDNLGIVR